MIRGEYGIPCWSCGRRNTKREGGREYTCQACGRRSILLVVKGCIVTLPVEAGRAYEEQRRMRQ